MGSMGEFAGTGAKSGLVHDPPAAVGLPAGSAIGLLRPAADLRSRGVLAAIGAGALVGAGRHHAVLRPGIGIVPDHRLAGLRELHGVLRAGGVGRVERAADRSEEHTSELQSLMRISYAVFCLKKKTNHTKTVQLLKQRTSTRMKYPT